MAARYDDLTRTPPLPTMISLVGYQKGVMDMKKLFVRLLLMLPLLAMTGCDPFPSENEDEGKAEFVNKSKYRVTVSPEARSGWSGFALAPGERRTLYDVYDVFFTYEPVFRVKVGRNENNKIVFVNNAADIVEVTE